MSCNAAGKCSSSWFVTLSQEKDLSYFDSEHAAFGKVVEGLDVLEKINSAIVDASNTPYVDIRILHTVILDDPLADPEGMPRCPSRSPSPTPAMLQKARLDVTDTITPLLPADEMAKLDKKNEATAQALTLELVGDLPFAEIKPPENVLFVAKLNTITTDDDLHLIFSRFGDCTVKVVRDETDGRSLGYAFVEYESKDDAEMAYFKMDKVLIDDKRIHVDFSQSVAKIYGPPSGYDDDEEGKEEYGGYGLQRKTLYRSGDSSRMGARYDMVFEDADLDNARRARDDDMKEKRAAMNEAKVAEEFESHDEGRDTNRFMPKKDQQSSVDRKDSYRSSRDDWEGSRGYDRHSDDRRYRDRTLSRDRDKRDDDRRKRQRYDEKESRRTITHGQPANPQFHV